jgi:hypothetical protein
VESVLNSTGLRQAVMLAVFGRHTIQEKCKMKNVFFSLLAIFIITACKDIAFVDTFVRGNNIYVTKTNGKIEQVTYTGKDSHPLLASDKKTVYFIRQGGNIGEYEYKGVEQLAVMRVDLENLKEEKLTDTIHYKDWKTTREIYEITGFTLSQDGRFIVFITQKWATSGVLVKLNPITRQLTEISHGDKFEVLKDGQYKDYIIVTRSSIKSNAGRQWSNWLIDIDGNEIKEIGDADAVTNFKLQQHDKNSR